jgi:hypothetical protein
MIKCNCCGRENSNYAIYCEGCGSVLSSVSDSADVSTSAAEGVESSSSSSASEPVSAESAYTPTYETPAQPNNSEYVPPEYTYNSNPAQTNGTQFDSMCIAGLICSISGIFCCAFTSLIGVILSIVGLIRVSKSGKAGKGLAIAGIIIGSFFIVISILVLILSNGSSYYYSSSSHSR